MYLAEDIIAPGGPSAPAWAFFTAIFVAVIGVLGQQIASKKEARSARENAEKAVANTANVSNGFVGRMDTKLDSLQNDIHKILEWQLDHQDFHLREGDKK